MSRLSTVRVTAVIKRNDDALPRFVVIPGRAFAGWDLEGTTVVDTTIEGEKVGRRSLKQWRKGADVWFIDLPGSVCSRLDLETGRRVEVALARVSEDLPAELVEVLQNSSAAGRNWAALTVSQKRALREHIFAASRSATRTRRAERALVTGAPNRSPGDPGLASR